jgi:hypothetical protein
MPDLNVQRNWRRKRKIGREEHNQNLTSLSNRISEQLSQQAQHISIANKPNFFLRDVIHGRMRTKDVIERPLSLPTLLRQSDGPYREWVVRTDWDALVVFFIERLVFIELRCHVLLHSRDHETICVRFPIIHNTFRMFTTSSIWVWYAGEHCRMQYIVAHNRVLQTERFLPLLLAPANSVDKSVHHDVTVGQLYGRAEKAYFSY